MGKGDWAWGRGARLLGGGLGPGTQTGISCYLKGAHSVSLGFQLLSHAGDQRADALQASVQRDQLRLQLDVVVCPHPAIERESA